MQIKKSLKLIFHLCILLLIQATSNLYSQRNITIMLDPAGSTSYTGRQIIDTLERGISLQFCQKIKKKCALQAPWITIIITRNPGQDLQPLQNANFANKLNVDYYFNINFYKEKATKPNFFIYYFAHYNDFITQRPDIYFCPFDQAHLQNSAQTHNLANSLCSFFKQNPYKKSFLIHEPVGLQFKPLVGIVAPALGLEIGLKKSKDWKQYIEPLLNYITTLS